MINAQQIKERMEQEKDPLQYIDEEIARTLNQLAMHSRNIQEAIAAYSRRAVAEEQFDLEAIKNDLVKTGELFFEVKTYQKVRTEKVKHLKRSDQVKKAKVQHEQWADRKGKNAPDDKKEFAISDR